MSQPVGTNRPSVTRGRGRQTFHNGTQCSEPIPRGGGPRQRLRELSYPGSWSCLYHAFWRRSCLRPSACAAGDAVGRSGNRHTRKPGPRCVRAAGPAAHHRVLHRLLRRSSPISAIAGGFLSNLEPTGSVVTGRALVAALRRETGCSRVTAYRAVSDALASGEIKRANGC
jgi:hypothetical protein